MGDSYVWREQSSVTWPALLSIVRDARRCSSPQDVPKRRSLRTQSPSGSREWYHWPTSYRGKPYRFPLPWLGKPVVLPRLFFSRIMPSARFWRRLLGVVTPPSRAITPGTCPTIPSTPSTWAPWWRLRPWYNLASRPWIPYLDTQRTHDVLSYPPGLPLLYTGEVPYSSGKYSTTPPFPLQPCLDIGNSWKN